MSDPRLLGSQQTNTFAPERDHSSVRKHSLESFDIRFDLKECCSQLRGILRPEVEPHPAGDDVGAGHSRPCEKLDLVHDGLTDIEEIHRQRFVLYRIAV